MSKNKPPENETLLGIDYGETNIGLAFGRNGLVHPLKTIPGKNQDEAIKEISRMVLENKVDKLVMGLPLTAEGKETKESHRVRRFSKYLKVYLKKPLIFVNEHLSTKMAMEDALSSGVSKKGRKKIDHLSAALILRKHYGTDI